MNPFYDRRLRMTGAPRTRRACAAGIVAIFLLSSAPASAADQTVTTTLADLAATEVSYGNMQTTISGHLLVYGSSTPLAGRTIDFQIAGLDNKRIELGTATTGTDGGYSFTTTVPELGHVYAAFAGDAADAKASGFTYLDPIPSPTRVTLDPLPATITAETWQTVTGTVEIQTPDGTWIPATDAYVIIQGQGGSYGHGRADADGHYRTSLWIQAPGPYTARSTADPYSFADDARSSGQPVDLVPTQARLTGFTLTPAHPTAQGTLTFQATAEFLTTAGTTTSWSPGGGPVHLYYRPKGSATWQDLAAHIVYYPGTMLYVIPGYRSDGKPASGDYQLQEPATPTNQATSSPAITVAVHIQTWLNNTKIKKSGASHYLTGVLDKQAHSTPVPGQTIKLYYRLRGSSSWHYLRSAKTTANGAYTLKLTGKRRYYRAVYTPAAGSDYLPATSTSLYFSS
jgi:hypothetical protein